jgi:hypothetical protein
MSKTDRYTKTLSRLAGVLVCVLGGLMLLACASAGTRKTSSAKIAKNVTAPVPELTSRNQSLLAIYSAEIESAADKIIIESRSPTTRRAALEWKAEAIPVMQASLLKTDPIAAVLDTWAYIFQISAYMQRPIQKQRFGEFDRVITETLKNMDLEMERVVRIGAQKADIADLRRRVSAWADAHPIRTSLSGRESVDAELIKKAEESDLGTMASLKAIGESIGDLTTRLDAYNLYLPKQSRWQAELLLSDITRDPQVDTALSNFSALSNRAEKASMSIDRMPEIVAQAREAVNADVDGQRLSAQAFLREERVQTLIALREERIATLAAMRGERLAATSDFRGERQVVLDSIHKDQEEVMGDIQALSDKALQDLEARGEKLIDHFFMRALELLLLMLSLCFLAAWFLLRSIVPDQISGIGSLKRSHFE